MFIGATSATADTCVRELSTTDMRIALYQGRGLLSRAIRFQTRSKYSHAAFLLNDGSVIEAWQPCVRHVMPCAPGGHGEPLFALSKQHTPGTVVDIFQFVTPLDKFETSKLEYLAKCDIGTPYDYKSIVRFLTRERGDGSKRKLFCSEQVFSRCAQVGRLLLQRTEPWRVPPD